MHGHNPELPKLGPEGRVAPFQQHAPAQEGHGQSLLQEVHTLLGQKALCHTLVQGKAQQKFNYTPHRLSSQAETTGRLEPVCF